MAVAVPAVALLSAVASVFVGPAPGIASGLGFGGFYLWYEVLHRREHTHPPAGPYGRFLRRHHLWHHYHCPDVHHGVTTPLWDFVFGTFVAPELLRVPLKLAPHWLVSRDEAGEPFMDERWAADYELRIPRSLEKRPIAS